MKTDEVLLKLIRGGYEFDRAAETDRNYVLVKGEQKVLVPKKETLTRYTAAEILRQAGLLLMMAVMLAGLSSPTQREGSADPECVHASMLRLTR